MDAQIKRRRTLEAIKRILLRESLNQPLVVIFEDLHWIDDETQALLDLLADAIANARDAAAGELSARVPARMGQQDLLPQLRLDPLGRESAEEMLAALLGDDDRVEPLKRLIIERTEGNPFFMEEMVQALFDEGALVRNGAVKLTQPLSRTAHPADGAGDPRRAYRPAAGGRERAAADAGGDRPGVSAGLIRQVTASRTSELERMLATCSSASSSTSSRPSARPSTSSSMR